MLGIFISDGLYRTIKDYKGLYRTIYDYKRPYRTIEVYTRLNFKTGDIHTHKHTDRHTKFVESWGAYAPRNKIAENDFFSDISSDYTLLPLLPDSAGNI